MDENACLSRLEENTSISSTGDTAIDTSVEELSSASDISAIVEDEVEDSNESFEAPQVVVRTEHSKPTSLRQLTLEKSKSKTMGKGKGRAAKI